jgi:3-oxoacyl-[acyl-carrier protein] reductase
MDKRVILITGASRGIGRNMALEFSKENIVVANYNNSSQKAHELQEISKYIDIYKADVSDYEQVKNMVKYALDKYGKIDVLINNAGIALEKMFQDTTIEDFNKVMQVNYNSVFYTIKEVLPSMIEYKSGLIINISSIDGISGMSCSSVYSASKAAIDGLTKSLAKELGPSGIRINSIAPGWIDTDMNSVFTEEEAKNFADQTPLGRIGKPEDITKCAKWLIEDEFTTGQVISVNGGVLI